MGKTSEFFCEKHHEMGVEKHLMLAAFSLKVNTFSLKKLSANNMFTKIYWIHHFDNGSKLGIMPRPRGDDWLEEEIIKLKKQNVGIWVSLLESHETKELGLRNQETLSYKHELEFINFPIIDRGIPEKSHKIDLLIEQLFQRIQDGAAVVIHCRMGIGRSSIIAACILLKAGFKTEQILQKISSVRGLKVPDTDIQVQWLKNMERNMKS